MNLSKYIAKTAIIATSYFVLTILIAPLSYGAIQFRFSEALGVLVLFFPEAIAGLTIGCLLANLFGNGVLDILLGTFATFLAAIIGYFASKKLKNFVLKLIIVQIANIVLNALIVPFTFLAFTQLKSAYIFGVLTVGLGQLVVLGTLGTILAFSLKKFYNKNINDS